MADTAKVTALNAALDKALELFKKDLIRRKEWGSITFEGAEPDLKRAQDILNYLKQLPTEDLPDNVISQIICIWAREMSCTDASLAGIEPRL